jgi:hypothetical protein
VTQSLSELRDRLLPAGTRLRDVPAKHRGLTVAEYVGLCFLESREAAEQWGKTSTAAADMAARQISTSRDNYGWRSLPSGSRFIGTLPEAVQVQEWLQQ